MSQILATPGYTCNHLRLLPQNSFDDVELPVPVENRRCNNDDFLLSQSTGHAQDHSATKALDGRTFRPVAAMMLEKQKLMHMDHIRSIASTREGTSI